MVGVLDSWRCNMADKKTETTVRLVEEKPCKGSVRYGTNDPDAPISNIYLSRAFANPMPKAITITIREG